MSLGVFEDEATKKGEIKITKQQHERRKKGNENKIVSRKISKTREQKENTDNNPKNIDVNKEKFKQEIKQILTTKSLKRERKQVMLPT